MTRIATAILATATFAACNGPKDSALVLASDFWVAEYGTADTLPANEEEPADRPPSIEFLDDGQMQGFTCCNSFFGHYTTRDSSAVHLIRITIDGVTLTFCPHSDREEEYLELLKRARSYEVDRQQLKLLDGTGKTILIFIPASKTQKRP